MAPFYIKSKTLSFEGIILTYNIPDDIWQIFFSINPARDRKAIFAKI